MREGMDERREEEEREGMEKKGDGMRESMYYLYF